MGWGKRLEEWLGEEVKLSWGEVEKKDARPVVDEEKLMKHKIKVIAGVLVKYFVSINENNWADELAKSEPDLLSEVLTILGKDALKAMILSQLVQDKAIKALKPKEMDLGEYSIEVMRRIDKFVDSLRIARSR